MTDALTRTHEVRRGGIPTNKFLGLTPLDSTVEMPFSWLIAECNGLVRPRRDNTFSCSYSIDRRLEPAQILVLGSTNIISRARLDCLPILYVSQNFL